MQNLTAARKASGANGSKDVESDEKVEQLAEAFTNWAYDLGYELPPVEDDEEKHRFATDDDDYGKESGEYVFYIDGGGYLKDYKSGLYETFKGKGDRKLSPAEIKEREDKREARKDRRTKRSLAAARSANIRWNAATREDEHPYLKSKGVQSHGLRLEGSSLLVPVKDLDDNIKSLQEISPEGDKKFLADGRTYGGLFPIGLNDSPEELFIVEGYATGATVHEATGKAVVVAFNAGNLKPVAEAVRSRYPDALITIAGDNDHVTEAKGKGNPGREYAGTAALIVGAQVSLPDFEPEQKGSDWNDYAKLHGSEATAEALSKTVQPDAASSNSKGRKKGGSKNSAQSASSSKGSGSQSAAIPPSPPVSGSPTSGGRPRVQVSLDGEWRDIALAVGNAVGSTKEVFYRAGGIVTLEKEGEDGDGDGDGDGGVCFSTVSTLGACSKFEEYCEFTKADNQGNVRTVKIPESVTKVILSSDDFKKSLPRVSRIADYPVPVRVFGETEEELHITKPGYCEITETYTDPKGPRPEKMSSEEGVAVLKDLLVDFAFAEEEDEHGKKDGGKLGMSRAIAYLLTCHCRGLVEPERSPVFYASGNRPGVGKDLLLNLGPLLTTGSIPSEPPPEGSEELRKRLFALCRKGKRFMIIGNWKGHLSNSALENYATSKRIEDRQLGVSDTYSLPNKAIYAISGNGLTLSEDMVRRMFPLELEYFGEDNEEREVKYEDLHGYAYKNRNKILGALNALVTEWGRQGCPEGTRSKASFMQWAKVIGGIMEVNGLGNPIRKGVRKSLTQFDGETENFTRMLYELKSIRGLDTPIEKGDLKSICFKASLFDWLGDFSDPKNMKAAVMLGKVLARNENRHFDGLKLEIDKSRKRPSYIVKEA